MKLAAALLVLVAGTAAGAPGRWSAPVSVRGPQAGYVAEPGVLLLGERPLVLWAENAGKNRSELRAWAPRSGVRRVPLSVHYARIAFARLTPVRALVGAAHVIKPGFCGRAEPMALEVDPAGRLLAATQLQPGERLRDSCRGIELAASGTGHAVAAWDSGDLFLSVRRPGASFEKPTRIGSGAGDGGDEALAMNRRGDAVLAWAEHCSGCGFDIKVATRRAGGRFARPVTLARDEGAEYVQLKAALDGRGRAVVSWTTTASDVDTTYGLSVMASYRSASGRFRRPVALGELGPVNGTDYLAETDALQAAFDTRGRAGVAWNAPHALEDGEVQLRTISPRGIGPVQRVGRASDDSAVYALAGRRSGFLVLFGGGDPETHRGRVRVADCPPARGCRLHDFGATDHFRDGEGALAVASDGRSVATWNRLRGRGAGLHSLQLSDQR